MVPDAAASPSRAHVLVIEDEVIIRLTIADALRDTGFTVIEASNADEAWAYLKSGGAVDVVFSDVRMPGSLNGLDLAREIKKHFPALPIILTSSEIGGAVNPQDFGTFIPKPYDIDRTVAAIRRALDHSRDGGIL